MIKLQSWIGKFFSIKQPAHNQEKLISDAKYLINSWPSVDEIPGDTLLAAFGLAAYLYCRERELEMKRHVDD